MENKMYSFQKYTELCEKTGKTTYQICKETGITESVIANWKKRGGNLTLENMAKIAKCFGVPIETFVR